MVHIQLECCEWSWHNLYYSTNQKTNLIKNKIYPFQDYKNENVDVFSESVFLFCSPETSDEIMERFIDYLYGLLYREIITI